MAVKTLQVKDNNPRYNYTIIDSPLQYALVFNDDRETIFIDKLLIGYLTKDFQASLKSLRLVMLSAFALRKHEAPRIQELANNITNAFALLSTLQCSFLAKSLSSVIK